MTVYKTPTVLQSSSTECGLAVLASMFAYFGCYVPLEELREVIDVQRDGCSVATLIMLANEYHFSAAAYRIDLAELDKLNEPVIIYWDFNHYVILNGKNSNDYLISDPRCGHQRISAVEFDKRFTGIAIRIVPSAMVKKRPYKKAIYPLMLGWVKGNMTYILLSILASLIYFTALLCASLYLKIFYSDDVTQLQARYIALIVMIYMMLYSLTLLFQCVVRMYHTSISLRSSVSHFHHNVSRMFRLPMRFFASRNSSEIISCLNSVESSLFSTFNTCQQIGLHLLICICIWAVLLVCDAELAMLLLVSIITYVAVIFTLVKRKYSYNSYLVDAHCKLYTCYSLLVKFSEMIKLTGAVKYCVDQWQYHYNNYADNASKIKCLDAVFDSLSQLLPIMLSFLLIYYMVMFDSRHANIAYVALYYLLATTLYQSVTLVVSSMSALPVSLVHLQKSKEINALQLDSKCLHVNDCVVDFKLPAIEVCHLAYSYAKHHAAIFKYAAVTLSHGKSLAITGRSGSGKSTLAKLLCGLYAPRMGVVKVFGQDIAALSYRQQAKLIAYMSQDTYLQSGSLYDNLKIASESASMRDIEAAIEIVELRTLISKIGLKAKLNELTSYLSGGERQRLHLARIILQNTPIIILDEATSALDAALEERIIRRLFALNKTIVFIAHRPAVIALCDHVIEI